MSAPEITADGIGKARIVNDMVEIDWVSLTDEPNPYKTQARIRFPVSALGGVAQTLRQLEASIGR
jgi:hypothetical protein